MRQTNPNSVLDKREKSHNPAERKDPPQESHEWTPYAPYPFNLLRDGLHRRRWWVRLVIAIIVLPWLIPFAYTRLTTLPADPRPLDAPLDMSAAVNIPDPTVDRTKEIDKAINALDPGTSFTVPAPPPGMMWITGKQYAELQAGKSTKLESSQGTAYYFDVSVALNGPWIPDRRAHLAAIVKHLESKPVADALDTIAELSDEPFCLTAGTSNNQMAGARAAVKHLVTRSRYHLAGRQYFEAALRDMEAALQLAEGVLDDGTLIEMLVAIACRGLAVSELKDWIGEDNLSDSQLAQVGRLLDAHALDYRDAWRITVAGEIRFCLDWMDREYTRTEDGEGWFVLRRHCKAEVEENRHDVFAFLNLLSPLFNDRSSAAACFRAWEPYLLAKVDEPYLYGAPKSKPFVFPVVLEPVRPAMGYTTPPPGRSAEMFLRSVATERGTQAMAALYRHKLERGSFPQELAQLVPDYLPAVPIDPFSGKPPIYRLDAEKGYVLYSVGADGKDDGGAWSREEQGPDWPLPVPWHKARYVHEEWFLVPTNVLNQPGSDDNSE